MMTVRAGRIVAVLAYADDGHGGWLIRDDADLPGRADHGRGARL